jgi:hypothetical protein
MSSEEATRAFVAKPTSTKAAAGGPLGETRRAQPSHNDPASAAASCSCFWPRLSLQCASLCPLASPRERASPSGSGRERQPWRTLWTTPRGCAQAGDAAPPPHPLPRGRAPAPGPPPPPSRIREGACQLLSPLVAASIARARDRLAAQGLRLTQDMRDHTGLW